MTRITFEEVARYAQKSGKCLCGTFRVRKRKFYQTLSPFNKVNGIPKTGEQIANELSAEIKAWQSEPILCSKCEAGAQSAAAQE
ncbi:MAG TPA: hypothetical protein VF290_02555 [Pyrinomonadaceae bacterium]